jgi:RNA polymerase sigma factor (sigma-70 family)
MGDGPTQIPSSRVSEAREASSEEGSAPRRGGVEPPSREVLERVRSRDPEALGAFFDTYFDRIYGLAYRMLGDHSAAQDVAQDIFLKVHRGVDRLDTSRDPGPWLTAITCNACREFWRGRHHKAAVRSVPIEEVAERDSATASPAATPEQTLLRKEREGHVQAAIARLPETLREVVLLHDYQGHGHREIAEIVGATYAAVRKRYSRALAELAKELKGRLE